MIRLLPRSTFGLVALVSVAIAVASGIVGYGLHYVMHERIEHHLDQRIADETGVLLAAHKAGGKPALIATIGERQREHEWRGMGYLYVDAAGRRIAGSLRATAPPPGWHEFLIIERGTGERGHAQTLSTVLPDGGRLVVAADRRPVDESDRAILQITIGLSSAMLVVGVAAAWLLGAITRRRLDRMTASAQAIIEGDNARRMPRDANASEFDRLAETLNQMLDRNAGLLENLRQVSTDIAHDLRTPLARQQQILEAALTEEAQDGAAYREAIERAADSGREMLGLFAALLRISEIETFDVRNGFGPVDLSEAVERVCEAFAPDVEASGHRLEVRIEPDIRIDGDRHLLSQMLVNLIENGVRHTPAGSTIRIALSTSNGHALLSAADDGPGVLLEDRERILRRFARLEQSRSTPGNGLGLSLASAVARAHLATFSVGDNAPGLRIEILFSIVLH